ncbi:MAG: 5-formyltetrahydrofolate cyclo-ligase [Oscillospiraceae bacterium]
MGAAEDKQALRQALRAAAAQLDEGALAAGDAAMAKRLQALDVWREAKTVFCYVSVRTEPGTRALIAAALAAGKRVCVPRCLGGAVMEARAIPALEVLKPAGYGLLEPDDAMPRVPPQAIDLVVAPCVAADRLGYRLGNGAGYYDAYLPKVRCPVVCLCRAPLLQAKLPREAFDVPVTLVVSENEVLGPFAHEDTGRARDAHV